MKRSKFNSPSFWGFIYILLIPSFTFIYVTFFPSDFYHSTVQFEKKYVSVNNNYILSGLAFYIDSRMNRDVVNPKDSVNTKPAGTMELKISCGDLEFGHENFKFKVFFIPEMNIGASIGYKDSLTGKIITTSIIQDTNLKKNKDFYSVTVQYEPSEVHSGQLKDMVYKKEKIDDKDLLIFSSHKMEVDKSNISSINMDLGGLTNWVFPDSVGIQKYLSISKKLVNEINNQRNNLKGFPSQLKGSWWRMMYFSAITITTVGFGDIVPISDGARIFVALEAILGIIVIGLFLNSIANKFSDNKNS